MTYPSENNNCPFAEKIQQVKDLCDSKGAISLEEVNSLMGVSGNYLISCLLVVPFLQPIAIPGLSTLSGLMVALSGLSIALRRSFCLPNWLKGKSLRKKHVDKLANVLIKVLKILDPWLKPQAEFMQYPLIMKRINGLVLAIAGVILSLPLPVPGTNTLPAISVLLLCLGYFKKDGIAIMLSYIILFLAISYLFFLLIFSAKQFAALAGS